ncbi:MAG: PPOX class F420-dependent oxidoreductase [Nitrosopumilaceae archaeon]
MNQPTITPEIEKLLKGKNFASISTLMKNGSPQVSITWIDYDGTNILINTAEGRLKTNNAWRDPRVAIVVSEEGNPYNSVNIRGKVIEYDYDEADEHIDKLAKQYFGLDKYPRQSPNEKRIIRKIQPERVFHMKPPS